MNQILLKNGSVYLDKKIQKLDLLILGNKISLIKKDIAALPEYKIIDCINNIISPSFIDGHVHTRVPGFEYKEDIEHFTKACVNSGILDVVAMGNVMPCPDTIENYNFVTNKLKNNFVNIHQVATVTKKIAGKELTDFQSLNKKTFLFSDDGAPIWNPKIMEEAMKKAENTNIIFLLHEECKECNPNFGYMYKSDFSIKNNLKGFDEDYESKIIQRDFELLKKYKNINLHIQHISTKSGADLVNEYKNLGYFVSAEVTPHHLIFSSSDITSNDGNYKMNPPLGNKDWKDTLVKYLNDGLFEAIVTDHAPHSKEEKKYGFEKSCNGIIGVETMFPSLYTYLVKTNKVALETILEHITSKPANFYFKNSSHSIKENNIANLAIIDLNKKQILTEKLIQSKSKNTPLLNKELQGWVVMTIKEGQIIYNNF